VAKKPDREATYEDLLALPDHVVGEIIDGELIVSPRPATPHATSYAAIGADLFGRYNGPPGGGGSGPGGWCILLEPELHFGKNVLVPDLAGWRRERMPRVPNVAAIELPPDWVCEIASPRTARIDRTKKRRVYARVKVAHMWIVDPIGQTLEVYRLENDRWFLVSAHGGEDKARAEPFEATPLDMKRWWLEETPEP
jgi:Uma2 family endonuclease